MTCASLALAGAAVLTAAPAAAGLAAAAARKPQRRTVLVRDSFLQPSKLADGMVMSISVRR